MKIRLHAVVSRFGRRDRRPIILHGVDPAMVRSSYRMRRRHSPANDARAHTVASWVGLADAVEVES